MKINKPVEWTPVFKETTKHIIGFDVWVLENFNKYHKKST